MKIKRRISIGKSKDDEADILNQNIEFDDSGLDSDFVRKLNVFAQKIDTIAISSKVEGGIFLVTGPNSDSAMYNYIHCQKKPKVHRWQFVYLDSVIEIDNEEDFKGLLFRIVGAIIVALVGIYHSVSEVYDYDDETTTLINEIAEYDMELLSESDVLTIMKKFRYWFENHITDLSDHIKLNYKRKFIMQFKVTNFDCVEKVLKRLHEMYDDKFLFIVTTDFSFDRLVHVGIEGTDEDHERSSDIMAIEENHRVFST